MSETPEVVDVTVDRESGVTIEWSDGFVGTIPLGELRAACPCAACRGRREQGREPEVHSGPAVSIAGAELVGAWGISVRWQDGHDAGIYPWDRLRSWLGG